MYVIKKLSFSRFGPSQNIRDDDRPNTKRDFLATPSRRQPDHVSRLGITPHLLRGPAAAGRRGAVDITLRTARTGKLESVVKLHQFVILLLLLL